jgi:20S proteasome subunit beta 5
MFENSDNENFGLPSKYDDYTHESDQDMHDITKFKYANIPNPSHFCHDLKQSSGPERELMNHKKGTTCLAFRTAAGVCIAVDSRASMGDFNSSETCRKVIELNEFLLSTLAGGAADCQYW